MAVLHATMGLSGHGTRTALWWRSAGFPVPESVPDHALGTIKSANAVEFSWDWQPKPSEISHAR